jgi:CBS domain containing-hemolysin-like protein
LVLVLLLYFCGELLPAVLAVRNLKALTPVSVLMLRFWSLALAPLILPFVHLLRERCDCGDTTYRNVSSR